MIDKFDTETKANTTISFGGSEGKHIESSDAKKGCDMQMTTAFDSAGFHLAIDKSEVAAENLLGVNTTEIGSSTNRTSG